MMTPHRTMMVLFTCPYLPGDSWVSWSGQRGSATDSEDGKRGRRGDRGNLLEGGKERIHHITSIAQGERPRMEREGAEGTGEIYWKGGGANTLHHQAPGENDRMEREGAEWAGENYWRKEESEHIASLQAPGESDRGHRVDGAERTGENYWSERANTLHHFKRLGRTTEDGKERAPSGRRRVGRGNLLKGGRE
jgi:hypothetical protein